jgi:hypothetical protein
MDSGPNDNIRLTASNGKSQLLDSTFCLRSRVFACWQVVIKLPAARLEAGSQPSAAATQVLDQEPRHLALDTVTVLYISHGLLENHPAPPELWFAQGKSQSTAIRKHYTVTQDLSLLEEHNSSRNA